jgi:hypothetical protein
LGVDWLRFAGFPGADPDDFDGLARHWVGGRFGGFLIAALLAEFAEGAEGAMEGGLGAAEVAVDGADGVVSAAAKERIDGAVGGVFEADDLGAAAAVEGPGGMNDVLDEGLLGRGGGLVLLDDAVAQRLVGFLLTVEDDGLERGETVQEGVLR